MVPARRFGDDRIQIWLRRWAMRRMYSPRKWTSQAILRNSHARYGWKRDHNRRRYRDEWTASSSESLDANQRAAMWLLPSGTDHAGGRSIEHQKESDQPR